MQNSDLLRSKVARLLQDCMDQEFVQNVNDQVEYPIACADGECTYGAMLEYINTVLSDENWDIARPGRGERLIVRAMADVLEEAASAIAATRNGGIPVSRTVNIDLGAKCEAWIKENVRHPGRPGGYNSKVLLDELVNDRLDDVVDRLTELGFVGLNNTRKCHRISISTWNALLAASARTGVSASGLLRACVELGRTATVDDNVDG